MSTTKPKCPDCAGIPGVYPNNQCPVCYVKQQYASKDDTDGEWLDEIFTTFNGSNSHACYCPRSIDNGCQCAIKDEYIVEAKTAIQSHIKSLLAAERQAIKAAVEKRELVEPVTHRIVTEVGDKVGIDLDADLKGSLKFIQDNGFNMALDQFHKIIEERDI